MQRVGVGTIVALLSCYVNITWLCRVPSSVLGYSLSIGNRRASAAFINAGKGSIITQQRVLSSRHYGALATSWKNGICEDRTRTRPYLALRMISTDRTIGSDEATQESDMSEEDEHDVSNDEDENSSSPALELYNTLHNALKKAMDANQRKLESLTSEYNKAQQAEGLQHRADLLMANLYMFSDSSITEATVQDWSDNDDGGVDGFEYSEVILQLNTKQYSSAQEEAETIYAQVRKMKRGTVVVQDLLQQNELAQQLLQQQMTELDKYQKDDESEFDLNGLEVARETIKRTAKRTGIKENDLYHNIIQQKQQPRQQKSGNANNKQKLNSKQQQQQQRPNTCRRMRTPDGQHLVLVGRNRFDNEYLSFHAARGNDIWMHARGCPGAHVLLQSRRGDPEVSDESLQFAANLAAFYSEARAERKAVITTAAPKHIQKPRGAPPGSVKLRQELPALIGLPEEVPYELKEAREESGFGWDEMGTRSLGGKAKHRKQTAAHTKQKVDQKRTERLEKQRSKRQKQHGGDNCSNVGDGFDPWGDD
jgi:hypothetical protein